MGGGGPSLEEINALRRGLKAAVACVRTIKARLNPKLLPSCHATSGPHCNVQDGVQHATAALTPHAQATAHGLPHPLEEAPPHDVVDLGAEEAGEAREGARQVPQKNRACHAAGLVHLPSISLMVPSFFGRCVESS